MLEFRFLSGKALLAITSLGMTLACSACANLSQTAKMKPQDDGAVHALYQESTKDKAHARTSDSRRNSEIQQLKAAEPVTKVKYRDPAFQQVGYSEETGSLASAYSQECPPSVGQFSGSSIGGHACPPDPRWPAAGVNPMAPGMMACDACNVPSPENYSDEYLCDGGDRDVPVHYDTVSRLGLDSEDTVLEFTDRAGNERMKPSNRVCIYAPRFAAVRTVSRPHEDHNTNEVAGVGHLVAMRALHSRLKASNEVKHEMSGGIAVRTRAGGLESEALQDTVSQLRSPSIHDKLLNLYQALTFVRSGQLDDTDSARLNYGIQAATLWTRNENPVICAKTDMVLEGRFQQSAAVVTGIEEKEESENLRIIKLADKKTAVTGDEIEFTIRYDNLGGREVTQVKIVDNLTPRLEYIVDSATSDREGRLILQDNGEGSQILVWEIAEPLKGKTGGVITFKVRVR